MRLLQVLFGVSEPLTEVTSGRRSIPHSPNFQLTEFRYQDVENQFHKFQVPIIQHSTRTPTTGQVTAGDASLYTKTKGQLVRYGS